VAAKLFRPLADANLVVDMIEQNVSTDGSTDISFTVPKSDLTRTMEVVEKVVAAIEAGGATADENIGRVSVVGAGMKTNPGVAAQMFETLAAEGVNIEMISTSTIRISCVVAQDDVERAVRALHAAFDLEQA
jgi:aspartate kinase